MGCWSLPANCLFATHQKRQTTGRALHWAYTSNEWLEMEAALYLFFELPSIRTVWINPKFWAPSRSSSDLQRPAENNGQGEGMIAPDCQVK